MFFAVYNIVIFYILITQDKKMAYVKKTKTSDTATPSKQNIAPPQPVKNNEDEDFSAELIKQINRDNGSKIAFNLAHDEAPTNIKRWISTGSTQLDYIIRNDAGGGAPEGRIIEIQGPPSSGKSHLAYEMCKSAQRMGGIAVYIDTENATSLENLIQVGIDVKKRFVFIQQTCIEEIFKIIESTIEKARNLKADIPVVVIWDSVAASSPKAEIDGDYDQNTIGLAARVLSKGLRKITHVIGDKNVLLVLLNQQRTKVGVMYGDPTTTPGGQAIPYHSSVRLKLTGGQQIKKTVNGKEMVIGINVAVKTIKNKVARPWREVEFEIHFGVGIRESEQLFDALREYCDKVKPKLNVNGVRPIIAGTSQWKELNLYDATTGVEIEQVKFFKSEFGKKIMGDPKYRVYADALVHACFHIPKEDNDHATLVGADMNSVEEAEAVALESGAEIENYN